MKRRGKSLSRERWRQWELAVSERRAVRYTYAPDVIMYQSFPTATDAQKAIAEHLEFGIQAELVETEN